jgi:hypothetical protein
VVLAAAALLAIKKPRAPPAANPTMDSIIIIVMFMTLFNEIHFNI